MIVTHYQLQILGHPESLVEVTQAEYVRAERAAGFHPKHGMPLDKPCTASFSAHGIRGSVVEEETIQAETPEAQWGSPHTRARIALRQEQASARVAPKSPAVTDACYNCGHSKAQHFDPNAYVPGKCNHGYDLCGCRDYQPMRDS